MSLTDDQIPAHRSWRLAVCLACLVVAGSTAEADGQAKAPPTEFPWSEAFAAAGELPTLRETCFASFDLGQGLTAEGDLRLWFSAVNGHPSAIHEIRSRLGRCAAIDGLVKLNMPWNEQAVLRVALDGYNGLQIHFFRGEQGATLVYHDGDRSSWAGYVTARKPGEATPFQFSLAATDDGRNRRTSPKNHDHYELRCRDNDVILSRGDVALLRVPFVGLPDAVYWQGKAAFHGLSAARTSGSLLADEGPGNGRNLPLADLAWSRQLDPDARVELNSDTGLRLSTTETAGTPSWITTSLPGGAIGEILLEIRDASPGAGIYLGNGRDAPRQVLRYVRNARSKQFCVLAGPAGVTPDHSFPPITGALLPVVAPHHWLRLVFGAGQVRWWVGPDGAHWAEPAAPIPLVPLDVTHIGLHCVGVPGGSQLTLRGMSTRELPHLAALADPELRRQAPSVPGAATLENWLDVVLERMPVSGNASEWRRASALNTLAAGCERSLANALLLLLVDDESTRSLPLGQQVHVLDDAALLMGIWDDHALLQEFVRRYHRAALAAFERYRARPFSAIRHALMTTPIATRHQFEVATEELLRAEFIQLVYDGQWQSLRDLATELRFFQLHTRSPLMDWAEFSALRRLPGGTMSTGTVYRQKDEWREVWIEELDKDVYNLLAQLRVELGIPGRADAARTIAGLSGSLSAGVAPHWRDGQLFVSLPTAVRSAVRDDEVLRTQLAEQYRDVAPVRLRAAIARGDVAAVELAAVQFSESAAAAEARLWLADRALAAGHFVQAASEYRQARRTAPPAQAASIEAKLQLAVALSTGQSAAAPAPAAAVNGTGLFAEDFPQLLDEMALRAAHDAGGWVIDTGHHPRQARLPQPAQFVVQPSVPLDGPVGNDPAREFAPDVNRRQLDWVGRQIGVAVQQSVMYVCNRFQVVAYDLARNKRIWQTELPTGQIQFAQQSTFTAARPLVSRDHILVRLLYSPGATLTCIDRANGQIVWIHVPRDREELVCDPFLLRGELACLKLVRLEQQELQLRLVTFDPRTGFPWREQHLLRLRENWRIRRYCERVAWDDGVIVALGGAIVRFDTAGQVRWIRKQHSLPPAEDPQWVTQYFQPPFLAGTRLFVAQPGVRELECLDRDTGERIWSRLFLELERIIGFAGPLLICQNSSGLLALNQDDGQVRWEHAAAGLTTAVTCDGEGGIVFVQRLPVDPSSGRYRPRLVWIDPATGAARGKCELSDLEDPDPRVGPLVAVQSQFWTFWGKGASSASRAIVQLSE